MDFTITLTGLDERHRFTGRTSTTLHTAECPTLGRARAQRPEFLEGWAMVADGRPVDHFNALRDDEFGLGRDKAYGQEQVYLEGEEAHERFARLHVVDGKKTCGRCKPETHLLASTQEA